MANRQQQINIELKYVNIYKEISLFIVGLSKNTTTIDISKSQVISESGINMNTRKRRSILKERYYLVVGKIKRNEQL